MRADSSPLIAGLIAALVTGAVVALAIDRTIRLEAVPRADPPAPVSLSHRLAPLSLRLVDLGGVGIPTDTASWGHDYSHNSKAFHQVILTSAPYVDESEFARLRADWTTYVRRIASYGNNGIVVPLFLELVSFERLPAVYAGTDLARRHRVLRNRFQELFGIARDAGVGIYLATDMAALTPPLERYLRRNGPLDASDPALWATYRAAFEEIFEHVPEVEGVVIRVGEAGPLYNRSGWDYSSEYLVESIAGLRTMLHQLLPAFEARRRTLVLRTWSVGVGELGDLHTNPATYRRALGDINSPSLVVSTKFPAGDFYRPLPINPTLLDGSHKRIVELQARPEFEGFAAFPNYEAAMHARALETIRAANPNVVGTWLWTQNGGPLRASPLSLYPLHGFWLWIDANTYTASRLAVDPDRPVAELTEEWVRRELTTDPAAVAALTQLLLLSPDPVERGLYIRPFAARRVTIAGFELPPLLWIMEWDIVGGWSAVWSNIYNVTKGDLPSALADGFAALETLDRMRAALVRARPGLAARPDVLEQIERSLAYETSLLETLAWYRAALLDYYRWLDTGDRNAFAAWRSAAPEFQQRAQAHLAGFGGNLDFPAFDLSVAIRSVRLAHRAAALRWPARVALALLVLGAVLNRAVRLAVLAPWRLAAERAPSSALLAAAAIALVGLTAAVGGALSFSSPWAVGVVPVALAAFALGLKASLTGFRWEGERDGILLAGLGPLLWAALVPLAIMSVRGPHYLWYLLWSEGPARVVVLAVAVGIPLATLVATAVAASRATGRPLAAAVGSVLIGVGATLAVLGLLVPTVERLLSALDRPLGLVPMTHAVVLGIATSSHLPTIVSWYPALVGGLLVVGGVLRLRSRVRGSRPADPAPGGYQVPAGLR